jgi:hypothetical protein
MRYRHILLGVALLVPAIAASQATPRQTNPERFDVTGLPQTASSALEKEIFTLLRYHKRGDLKDATRIHLRLAEYYKEVGDKRRADDCTKMAGEAWEAAEKGIRTSAGSPGTPPFEPAGAFVKNFTATDELGVTHRWEFFDDGTFAHAITGAGSSDAAPPTELGWYSVSPGQLRLWKEKPEMDRTVPFELIGQDGKNGVVLDGLKLKPAR